MTPENESNEKTTITSKEATKILASIPYMRGFHFYAAIGNDIEETASSFSEFFFSFCFNIKTLPEAIAA